MSSRCGSGCLQGCKALCLQVGEGGNDHLTSTKGCLALQEMSITARVPEGGELCITAGGASIASGTCGCRYGCMARPRRGRTPTPLLVSVGTNHEVLRFALFEDDAIRPCCYPQVPVGHQRLCTFALFEDDTRCPCCYPQVPVGHQRLCTFLLRQTAEPSAPPSGTCHAYRAHFG